MRRVLVLAVAMACLGLAGCGPVVIPTNPYFPQGGVRIESNTAVDVGVFTYIPARGSKHTQYPLRQNQLQTGGLNNVHLAHDIASLVKRITALELEKSGLLLRDGSNLLIEGDVLKFEMDYIGVSIDWTYVVMYRIIDKKQRKKLYEQVYVPEMKHTGKFQAPSDFSSTITELIFSGYEMFIRDPYVRDLVEGKEIEWSAKTPVNTLQYEKKPPARSNENTSIDTNPNRPREILL